MCAAVVMYIAILHSLPRGDPHGLQSNRFIKLHPSPPSVKHPSNKGSRSPTGIAPGDAVSTKGLTLRTITNSVKRHAPLDARAVSQIVSLDFFLALAITTT